MMNITAGKNVPNDINAIIEIPAFSDPIKYEVDKDSGLLVVDRFMPTCMQYPCNYGFIPSTLAEDGDPLDVLVVTPVSLQPGCMLRVRPIGVLNMTDEAGSDAKILALPIDKLTPLYKDVHEIEDLPALLLRQIKHFFEHYKDLEDGKWVKIEGWSNAKAAKQIIADCVTKYAK
ncbi:MAG: inorganic diphosphatase [Thiotrichales bacterium]|nr:MAG: inorganic diphosphatase [Thiotrichales bacterium]